MLDETEGKYTMIAQIAYNHGRSLIFWIPEAFLPPSRQGM